MTIRRTLGIGSAALLLVAVLTACFPSLPGLGGGGNPAGGAEIAGTSWSGTDSDGDSWEIEFQTDNTLGVSFNGDYSDAPEDVWSLSGSAVSMTVTGFTDGDVTFTGTYDGGDSLALNGSIAGRPFTLTLSSAG